MRHMPRNLFVALATAVTVVSCTEPTANSPAAKADRSLSEAASIPSEYVATPAGYFHRSCVIQIPEGAKLQTNGVVQRANGTKYSVAMTCAYPVIHGRRVLDDSRAISSGDVSAVQPARGAANPSLESFIEEARLTSATHLQQISADWRVPTSPLVYAFQSYFNFPGLLATNYILQPVVQFGVSGAGGGSYWSMTGWKCGAPGQSCFYYGNLKKVNAGDLIHSSIASSGCSGANCTWTISATDQTTGTSFTSTATDNEYYNSADGAAVEVHNIGTCNQLPVNGVNFSNISIVDVNGTHLTPSFAHIFGDTAGLACGGYSISTTATTATLLHNPSADLVTAAGTGLSGSTGCSGLCSPVDGVITKVSASGSVITLTNAYNATGTIILSGATASGSFAANCSFGCTRPGIAITGVSGHSINFQDGSNHTGTITLTGATLGTLAYVQTTGCGGLTCAAFPGLKQVSVWGANGIPVISDASGSVHYIKFQ